MTARVGVRAFAAIAGARVVAGALVLSLILPGCLYVGATSRAGSLYDPEVVEQIVPGTTTRAEVLDMLGPPSEFERPELSAGVLDDELRFASEMLAVSRRSRKVYTWQYQDVDMDGTVLILWNGFFADVHTHLVVVMFDEHEVVEAVSMTSREEES